MSASKADEALKRLQAKVDEIIRERQTARRIAVNKRTHRVRFENETEDEVTIVIEKKGTGQ